MNNIKKYYYPEFTENAKSLLRKNEPLLDKISDNGTNAGLIKSLLLISGIVYQSPNNIHKIYSKLELFEDIFQQLPINNDENIDNTFLVPYTIEWAVALHFIHCVPVNKITVVCDGNEREDCSKHFGFNTCTVEEFQSWIIEDNMKIKTVIGNPPYQDGDVPLYTHFFKRSLTIGDVVSLVMPTSIESRHVRLKEHNKLIKAHNITISDDISGYFNVGVGEIRNIIASKKINNNVLRMDDPLNSYQIIFPERKRLFPRIGKGEFAHLKNEDPSGIDCIVSIYRGGKIQWRKIKTEVANKVKKSMITESPWLVLIQQHPSNGLFNTAIIKNDGTKWGCGAYALDAESEDDAKELEKWLVSSIIREEVKKLLALKNDTHSISGPMVSKLPHYK